MPDALWQFGGSLVAVAAVVALVWFLGRSDEAALANADEARDLMLLAPAGFAPVQIAITRDRKAAIGRDADGQHMLLLPHGSQFVARLLESGAHLSASGEVLCITSASVNGGAIMLDLGAEAGHWIVADTAVS